MIDRARLLFSVGSARELRPERREVVHQLDPDECGLRRRAGIEAQLQHCLSEEHRA